jgi:hypothetical protein
MSLFIVAAARSEVGHLRLSRDENRSIVELQSHLVRNINCIHFTKADTALSNSQYAKKPISTSVFINSHEKRI